MNTGIGQIICDSICNLCSHKWIAIVEVDYIDFGDKKEYKKPDNLECPNCNGLTDNYHVINFTIEKKTENKFISRFFIMQNVHFRPMYRHQKKMGIEDEVLSGKVVSVKFTEEKVFYDIYNSYWGVIFKNIDSSKVYEIKAPKEFDD